MADEYKSLRLEKNDRVAEVVLTGPGKGNAMGPDFWREMPEVFAALDRDEETRAVIVRGEGDNFSYGLDLAAMMGDIARMLQKRGYRFISLEEALTDPAYQSADTFTGAAGISWIHRWFLTKGKQYLLPDEPSVPDFVLKAAGVDSE